MDITRLFDLPEWQKNNYPQHIAFAGKVNNDWKSYSTEEYFEFSNLISYGLLSLGLQPGDKIATSSNNRPEWNFIDMGMLQSGIIHVPVYPTASAKDLKFIFEDAEIKFVFVSGTDQFKKIAEIVKDIPSVKGIYTFDDVPGASNWKEVVDLGRKNINENRLQEIRNSIKPHDIATILYTSGTTGNPKGVMLSHNNIVSNFMAVRDLPPVDHTCRALSFLPLNHTYERVLNYLYQYLGVAVYYAESIETIADNLKEVKPHVFATVPRLLEKVYDKIVAKGNELTGIKRSMFFWSLNLGHRFELNNKNGFFYNLQLKLARKLIFTKWQEALGGNVRAIVSGGAALNPRLARIFWAADIKVLEGYGLTETAPVIAVNNLEPGGAKFGTVGQPIKGVEVKIAEDGEILSRGPNNMIGYYKRPDLTEEMIDADGWCHTGDIGVIEDGKYLKITDRKKEIFKTSGGKYIAPQALENKLKESLFIEQCMVIGENRKFAAALVVPSFAYLKEWCNKKGIPFSTNEEMVQNSVILTRINEEIEKINEELARYEQIKKIKLLPREWTIERSELTPKLSLKRKEILRANMNLVEEIYG
jgi:long-chain acyl-CoA synthetase